MRAAISPVPGVQLQVTIAATLVLEEPGAPAASVWHLIAMTLQLIISRYCDVTDTPDEIPQLHSDRSGSIGTRGIVIAINKSFRQRIYRATSKE